MSSHLCAFTATLDCVRISYPIVLYRASNETKTTLYFMLKVIKCNSVYDCCNVITDSGRSEYDATLSGRVRIGRRESETHTVKALGCVDRAFVTPANKRKLHWYREKCVHFI